LLDVQVARQALFGSTQRASQAQLRKVVSKEARDVIEIGGSDTFLRLHDLERIVDTCFIPLSRQIEGFAGNLLAISSQLHLTGRSLEVEECIAHVTLDAPA